MGTIMNLSGPQAAALARRLGVTVDDLSAELLVDEIRGLAQRAFVDTDPTGILRLTPEPSPKTRSTPTTDPKVEAVLEPKPSDVGASATVAWARSAQRDVVSRSRREDERAAGRRAATARRASYCRGDPPRL